MNNPAIWTKFLVLLTAYLFCGIILLEMCGLCQCQALFALFGDAKVVFVGNALQ